MRALIITVAGMSTRFNAGIKTPNLKSIYRDKNNLSLLSIILDKTEQIDKIVIVGGYMYDSLLTYIHTLPEFLNNKILAVFNPFYDKYGSGYSLYLGIECLKQEIFHEIIFVEGDLYFEKHDFEKIVVSNKNIITINSTPIYSKSAVVVYLCQNNNLHYLYNTDHGLLEIEEPFKAVFNSGQIWKFTDTQKLYEDITELTDEQIRGTNLEIIQKYFGNLQPEQYEILRMETWVNCNTIDDYDYIVKLEIKNRVTD